MRPANSLVVLALSLAVADGALARADRPQRKPAEGGEWRVSIAVLESHLSLPAGNATGVVWFQNGGNRKYAGETNLVFRAGAEEIAIAAPDFALDADEDAAGLAEEYAGAAVSRALLARSLTASDFALVPIRALQWQRIAGVSGERIAKKSVNAVAQSVEWSAERFGTARLGGLTHDQILTRCVRRFQPSGFEIHDYLFTAEYHSEKESEHYVAFATGYRAFVHPGVTIQGGKRPEGGLLALVRIQATRLEWDRKMGDGDPMVPDTDAATVLKRGDEAILDALFRAMEDEGIGDPFDSPALALVRRTGAFDKAAATRLINIGKPKPLAMAVPLIVEKGFDVDGAKFKKLWSDADDPVLRLLYAAGAQQGGKSDPAFRQETKVASNSSDPRVLRAALVLANALADPLLAADVEAALSSAK
jgi:hypothetical protein